MLSITVSCRQQQPKSCYQPTNVEYNVIQILSSHSQLEHGDG